MEMASRLAHNMLKVSYIFSLLSFRWGEVLPLVVPFKKRDTWVGKAEVAELKCVNIQKDLLALQKEVKAINYLHEAMILHGSPSSLSVRATKLKDALKDSYEWYRVTSASIEEKVLQEEKYLK